jgi:hypothetical protein
MVVKLKVSRKDDPQWTHEQVFDQEMLTIGRDLKSDLQLRDTKKIVSRHHAVIKQHGQEWNVSDLNSQNFTFLNDKKLDANIPYPLKNGDDLKIGEFTIHFMIEATQLEHIDKTLFSVEHPNPFLDDLQILAETLGRICRTYENEDFGRKNQSLKETMEDTLADVPVNEAFGILIDALREKGVPCSSTPLEHGSKLSASEKSTRTAKLVDILLELLANLVQARKEFRLEFLGETIVGSGSKFSLQDCTDQQLRDYYLTSEISSSETDARFKKLRNLADVLKHHQLSLLDGYKAGVSDGTKKVIKMFDPSVLAEKINDTKLSVLGVKLPLRFLPVVKHIKFKKLISDSFIEISNEDLSIIEKEYFRSGYIQAYYRRMDQLKKKYSKA